MSMIKSFSVGNGDMFYIKHNSDSFSIIDCCLNEDNREQIVEELKIESTNKNITRFISTHPDDDHIKGLAYLNKNMPIQNFYTVNNKTNKQYETEDFKEYCRLKNSNKVFHLEKDCKRCWLNLSNEERGQAGINILWPIINNEYYQSALKTANEGGSPNNISPIIQYSTGDIKALWMGDLETDFMKNIEDSVSLEPVDILFAPHHGRQSGTVPKSWLKKLNPQIIVIGEAPSENLNYYRDYKTITQNSAGDIVFECSENDIHIHVQHASYTKKFSFSKIPYPPTFGLFYIGYICSSQKRITPNINNFLELDP